MSVGRVDLLKPETTYVRRKTYYYPRSSDRGSRYLLSGATRVKSAPVLRETRYISTDSSSRNPISLPPPIPPISLPPHLYHLPFFSRPLLPFPVNVADIVCLFHSSSSLFGRWRWRWRWRWWRRRRRGGWATRKRDEHI